MTREALTTRRGDAPCLLDLFRSFFASPTSPLHAEMLRQRALDFVRQASDPQLLEALGPSHLRNAAEVYVQHCEAGLLIDAATRFGLLQLPPSQLSASRSMRSSFKKATWSRRLDTRLPDVLFRVICQFLPWHELLLRVRLVCRCFQRRISDPICWSWLRLQGSAEPALSKLLDLYCGCENGGMWSRLVGFSGFRNLNFDLTVLRAYKHMTFLDLSFCTLRSILTVENVSTYGARLRHFAAPAITTDAVAASTAACIASFCKLESLVLCGRASLDGCLVVLPKLPCLRCLKVTFSHFSPAVFAEQVGKCTQLQSITVMGCASLDDACVLAVAQGCPDLMLLALEDCSHAVVPLQHIAAHAHSLRVLAYESYSATVPFALPAAPSADWQGFCAGLPHLRSLRIPAMSDAHLEVLCRCCPRLQCLQFFACPALTDKGLCWIARCLPALRWLILDSDQVTDMGIGFLLCGCTRLECLDVSECPRLTEATANVLTSDETPLIHLRSLRFILPPALLELPNVRACRNVVICFDDSDFPFLPLNPFADPLALPAAFRQL